jgi:hypothetical protein
MTHPRYKGEALLLSWGDNKSGRKIVLQLEKDGPGSHPFDGLDGERFAVVIVGPLASTEHEFMGDAPSRENGVVTTTHHVPTSPTNLSPEARKAKGEHKPPKWADMKPAARAALLCKDPKFWAYLNAFNPHRSVATSDQAMASAELKTACGVESRAEIVEGSRAAAELSRIIGNFNAWKQAKGLGQI